MPSIMYSIGSKTVAVDFGPRTLAGCFGRSQTLRVAASPHRRQQSQLQIVARLASGKSTLARASITVPTSVDLGLQKRRFARYLHRLAILADYQLDVHGCYLVELKFDGCLAPPSRSRRSHPHLIAADRQAGEVVRNPANLSLPAIWFLDPRSVAVTSASAIRCQMESVMVPLMVAVTSCAAPRVGHKQTAKERILKIRTIECFQLQKPCACAHVTSPPQISRATFRPEHHRDTLVPKYETSVYIAAQANRNQIALSSGFVREFHYEKGFHRHELHAALPESA